MTAALVLEPRERTRATRLVTVRQEPEVIVRARAGDETALAEIFDAVVTEVYGYAFSLTHKAREAERITDSVVARLPRTLRRQRWESVQSLKDQLMSVARTEVDGYQRRQSRTEVRKDLRAQTRYLVLAATVFATASYAVLLAI